MRSLAAVRPDDRPHAAALRRAAGRSVPLQLPGLPRQFAGGEGGSTENVVELLFAILDAYAKTKPKASLESFWENTARQLLRNLIRVFRVARAQVRLDRLRTFIAEAPQDLKAVKSGAYQPGPLFGRLLAEAKRLSRGTSNADMIDQSVHYWMNDFPDLNPKTRSIVVTHFTSMVDMFFEPQIWELFCGETTIIPEAVFDGAVVVVDLPIEKYLSVGRIAAIIFKHFFQLRWPAEPTRLDRSGDRSFCGWMKHSILPPNTTRFSRRRHADRRPPPST